MTDVATAALSGTQKVAVVLMSMDPEAAAGVMKQFTEAEAEEIAAEIVKLRRVESNVADEVMTEYLDLTIKGGWSSRGGKDFANSLLEASFGAERAGDLMNRVASNMAGKAFEFLDSVDSGQIVTLMDGELPQTIALVLAHMRPDHAAPVLAALDDDVRSEVAQSIGMMGTAIPEAVRIVADTLKLRAGAVVSSGESMDVVGGIQPLVEIINRADISTEKALLERLDEIDPELAEEVRSRMLTFADIVKLERRDVQQVLRGIDTAVLAVAMKGTTEAVTEVIKTNLSERNRELLDDEVKTLGPVRASQVEEARAEVVRAIRDLEAQGSITVQRGGDEDEYVQ
jgi:flagellar motor switch protein FliG